MREKILTQVAEADGSIVIDSNPDTGLVHALREMVVERQGEYVEVLGSYLDVSSFTGKTVQGRTTYPPYLQQLIGDEGPATYLIVHEVENASKGVIPFIDKLFTERKLGSSKSATMLPKRVRVVGLVRNEQLLRERFPRIVENIEILKDTALS